MNDTANIPSDVLDDPDLEKADGDHVMSCVASGDPIDPVVAARVRARSLRTSEETLRRVGFVNIQELMRPDPNDDE